MRSNDITESFCSFDTFINVNKMQRLCRVMLLMFVVTAFCSVRAQTVPKRDSLYEKIEKFSKKRKVSKLLYHLIFRNVSDAVAVPNTVKDSAISYNGRHIRNITITTFDPLGYSSNFEKKDSRWLENVGNRFHMKTRMFTVRHYLLFKEGDAYNDQKIYESERILRGTKFINRVSIKPVPGTATRDSVDVAVRVLDSWSLKPMGDVAGNKIGVSLAEENFLGMGHELSARYRSNLKTKQTYVLAKYSANNLFGTYVNAIIVGENDFDNNENAYLYLYRDFISPLTRWGGGVDFKYFKRNIIFPGSRDLRPEFFPKSDIKMRNADVWAGYQFRMPPNSKGEITDNIGLAGRFRSATVLAAPPKTMDSAAFFRSYNMFLSSVAYTRRKFEVRKNIFRYDLPEDIPYGHSLVATGGVVKDVGGGKLKPYLGISASFGKFTKMGYFNYMAEYGTFFSGHRSEHGAIRFDGTYFSPLRDFGFAEARHFISHTFVMGLSRNPSLVDRINLATPYDFPAYDMNYVGKEKLVLRYQLQFFLKHQWKNFQINPYVMTTFGWLPDININLFDARTEMKFGIGAHFYNPYLAFNRFQVSLVYYPKLPFDGHGEINANGYRNNQFPFSRFRMEAPDTVNYSTYDY